MVAELNATIADVRALLPKAPLEAIPAAEFAAIIEEIRERQERAREATNVRVDSDAPPDEVEPKPPPSVSEKKGNKP